MRPAPVVMVVSLAAALLVPALSYPAWRSGSAAPARTVVAPALVAGLPVTVLAPAAADPAREPVRWEVLLADGADPAGADLAYDGADPVAVVRDGAGRLSAELPPRAGARRIVLTLHRRSGPSGTTAWMLP
jgi:hypothetical protein